VKIHEADNCADEADRLLSGAGADRDEPGRTEQQQLLQQQRQLQKTFGNTVGRL
jgi:hypothetical protein